MDQAKFAEDRAELLGLPRVAAIDGGNSSERRQGHGMVLNEAEKQPVILAEQPMARPRSLGLCFEKSDTLGEQSDF